MQTIYQLVEEVCSRDFPILALLSDKKQQKFIDIIYDDILDGEPEKLTEQTLHDYIQEFIAKAISVSIDDVVDVMEKPNDLQNMS